MSTFSGLNTGLTSLWAQRRALDVTGQNIANVNTDGYSRQRAELTSIGGSSNPAIHSTPRVAGGGVEAGTVIRIRDMFLESRAHVEHATNSRLAEESAGFSLIEQAFREPGDTGLQTILGDMWAGWSDVANQPHDTAARSQLLQQMHGVTGALQAARQSLDTQWDQTHQGLKTLIAEVNTSITAVAELNEAIRRANQGGLPANELTDRRDALVVSLANQVGATTRAGDDGVVNVYVKGTPLVYGNVATPLQVAGATSADDATGTPPRIETADGNYALSVGGTAEGRLTTLSSTLPAYRSRLDQVAADLVASVNAGQAAGYDLDGNPGEPMLSSGPLGGPVTAANITVAMADPRKVAASSVAPPAPPAKPTFDGGNADRLSQQGRATTGATADYRRLIVDLGVQAQGVNRSLAIQEVVSTQVDAARESMSGVNLDEEMANMLAFQHAYQAAGRLITAIDQTLDILINRTGIVGR